MFTESELKGIDRSYFNVLHAGCFTVTLQSRNTGHCWHILHEEYRHFKSCRIYHTHHKGTAFHLHGHGRDIWSCQQQIKSHDTYWLSRKFKRRAFHEQEEHQSRLFQHIPQERLCDRA